MLYKVLINPDLYDKCPKEVLAAMVVSFLVNHQGNESWSVSEEIAKEWKILYDQGLVTQKPKKYNKY